MHRAKLRSSLAAIMPSRDTVRLDQRAHFKHDTRALRQYSLFLPIIVKKSTTVRQLTGTFGDALKKQRTSGCIQPVRHSKC